MSPTLGALMTSRRLPAIHAGSLSGRVLLGAALLAAGVGAWACFDQPILVGPRGVVAVQVSPANSALRVGQQVRLRASALDSSAALVSGGSVVWTSGDPAVATVNDSGMVTGVAPGTVDVRATVLGLEGSATLLVDLAPAIAVSRDSVPFVVIAGLDAPPDSVTVTNGGGFSLEGLQVGTVAYGAGAADWLTAGLSADTAPASLTITPATAALTVSGVYRASVPVLALDAANAPFVVEVELTISPAPPSDPAIAVDDANIMASASGDVADTRSVVTVTLTDAFGNPRVGDIVTFTPSDADNAWRVSATDATASNEDTTDAMGVVSRTFFSTRAQPKILTAIIPGGSTKTIGVTVRAAPAATMTMAAGNGQTGIVGAALAANPAVLLLDPFGNPVGGQSVTFAVTAGVGSVTGGMTATNPSGMATLSAWTLGDGSAMTDVGTFANGLSASTAGVPDLAFTATGIYSYATHVQQIWNTSPPCLGCHGGVGGLFLAAPSWAALFDVNGVCNATVKLVASGGGIAAENASMLMRRMDNTAAGIAGCTTVMPPAGSLAPAILDIVRAWIRNGAPDN